MENPPMESIFIKGIPLENLLTVATKNTLKLIVPNNITSRNTLKRAVLHLWISGFRTEELPSFMFKLKTF